MKLTFLIISFIVFLLAGCNKSDNDPTPPDISYTGMLTEIEDGSPKVGWQVALSRYLVEIPITGVRRKVILGFSTTDENGNFSFDIKVSEADLDEFEPLPFDTGTKLEAFYRVAGLELTPPDPSAFPGSPTTYLPLDRANFVTGLSEWQENQVGQIVNNDLRIYTKELMMLNAKFRVERPILNGEYLTGTLALRDMAFNTSYKTLSSVNGTIGLSLDQGPEYAVNGRLPLNRPVETTFSFRTYNAGEVIDSLVIRDTLVAFNPADTLFLPDYVY